MLTVITLAANAQKLPNVQKTSMYESADIKTNDKAAEWNNQFQAYNKATNIYYTLANDDKNLYLIVQATDPGIINKILRGGVTFSINEAGKKNFKDAVSITYPILKKNNRLFLNFSAKPEKVVAGVASEFTQIDSFVSLNNKRLAERSKLIRVTGIKGVDTLISVYNQDGIKATLSLIHI